MPYGNKMPKKMGCSGGGPNMYKVGSKENDSPMNFSDKAMMYMKKMPAMYGKPKMDGDPVKDGALKHRRKSRKGLTTKTADPNIDNKTGYKGTGYSDQNVEYNKQREKEYHKKFVKANKMKKSAEEAARFIKENPSQMEFSPAAVKRSLDNSTAMEKRYLKSMMKAHKGAKKAPKMYKNKKK